jgi:acyl carrier protein
MAEGKDVHEELTTAVRKFISDNFLFREDMGTMSDDASFIEAGIMDSTGVLELIAYLEITYKIEIADEEMLPENFDSITRIVAYLRRKLEACHGHGEERSPPANLIALTPYYAG